MILRRRYIRLLRWFRLLPRNRKMTVSGIIGRSLRRHAPALIANITRGNAMLKQLMRGKS